MSPTGGLSTMSMSSRHQTPGRQSTGSGSASGGSTSGGFSGTRSGVASSHEEGGVRVVVRVRPLCEEEEATGIERTMRCCNPKALEFTGTAAAVAVNGVPGIAGVGGGGEGAGVGGEGSRQYAFDLCAHEGFDQEEMFQSCGLMPLLSAAINGYAGLCEERLRTIGYCFCLLCSLHICVVRLSSLQPNHSTKIPRRIVATLLHIPMRGRSYHSKGQKYPVAMSHW